MMASKAGAIWGGYLTPWDKFVFGVSVGQRYLMENTTLGIPALIQSEGTVHCTKISHVPTLIVFRPSRVHKQRDDLALPNRPCRVIQPQPPQRGSRDYRRRSRGPRHCARLRACARSLARAPLGSRRRELWRRPIPVCPTSALGRTAAHGDDIGRERWVWRLSVVYSPVVGETQVHPRSRAWLRRANTSLRSAAHKVACEFSCLALKLCK